MEGSEYLCPCTVHVHVPYDNIKQQNWLTSSAIILSVYQLNKENLV